MLTTHGKCGKTFPSNNTHGHCGSCHETFVGITAFDAHWITTDEGERACADPESLRGPWWKDAAGYWHRGEKLSKEQREKIWSGDLKGADRG